jgi:radical SAM superfamily enzyme
MRLVNICSSCAFAGLVLTGCYGLIGPSRAPPELANEWNFCNKSPQEQERLFPSLPIEAQIDTYLVCMRYTHPSQSGIAYYFSANGHASIRALSNRLDKASDDLTILDLVFAVGVVSRCGTYDVANDAAILSSVQAAVNRMVHVSMKNDGTEILRKILARERAKGCQ